MLYSKPPIIRFNILGYLNVCVCVLISKGRKLLVKKEVLLLYSRGKDLNSLRILTTTWTRLRRRLNNGKHG